MTFDFDKSVSRSGTNSYKWDDNLRQFGRADILPFWVADMDFACPEPILKALSRRIDHPVMGYSKRPEAYFAAIRSWLASRHNWNVPADWLAFNPPGPTHAIHSLIDILSKPGDSVIVQTPTYGPLLNVVKASGRQLIKNPLVETNGRFEMDLAGFERSVVEHTKILILCSPHNPTGRVWSEGDLSALGAICRKHRITVISDEVHADLIYPGQRHIPFGRLNERAEGQSVTLLSPGKSFNISGIPQCTLVIPDPALRARFNERLDVLQLNLDTIFATEATIAAYEECAPWLDALMAYVAGNFATAASFAQGNLPEVTPIQPEATFLAWLDFRGTGLPHNEIAHRLVHRGGIGLSSGLDFGPGGDGFFRMNLACPRALVLEGLDRIRAAIG